MVIEVAHSVQLSALSPIGGSVSMATRASTPPNTFGPKSGEAHVLTFTSLD